MFSDPSEVDSPVSTPRSSGKTGSTIYAASYPNPPLSPTDSAAFSYPAQIRGRSVSVSKDEPSSPRESTVIKPPLSASSPSAILSSAKEKTKLCKTDSNQSGKK